VTVRVGTLPRTLGRNLGELRRFLGGAGDAGVAVGQPGPGGAALGQLVHQRHPGRLGQLARQLAEFVEEQAVQVGGQIGAEPASSWSLVGTGRLGLSRIGQHPPLLELRLRPAGTLAAGSPFGLAAVRAPDPLVGQPLARSERRAIAATRRSGASRLSALSSTTVR
jgi:hypothetical protein